MEKLHKLLKLAEPKKGEYGVEIEIEGKNLRTIDDGVWHTERDGSLRGEYPHKSAEFVFDAPLSFTDSVKAINSLFRKLRFNNAEFDFSFRTSVHVHMNMLNHTLAEIYNTIYTYYLIEDVLVEYCGSSRKANRFCLTANAAEGILDIVKHLFQRGDGGFDVIARFNGDAIRYAALNLHALRKYGSLEFRSMRGTNDIEVLVTWLQALNNLKEFATAHEDVATIHDKFIKLGPKEFLQEVLGDVYEAFSIPQEMEMLNRSFSITLDLAHAVPPVMAEKVVKKEEKVANKINMDNLIQKPRIAFEELFVAGHALGRRAAQIRPEAFDQFFPVQADQE